MAGNGQGRIKTVIDAWLAAVSNPYEIHHQAAWTAALSRYITRQLGRLEKVTKETLVEPSTLKLVEPCGG